MKNAVKLSNGYLALARPLTEATEITLIAQLRLVYVRFYELLICPWEMNSHFDNPPFERPCYNNLLMISYYRLIQNCVSQVSCFVN